MNIQEAKKILSKPFFGDPECIAAKKIILDEAEAVELRTMLKGKKTECWCCEGRRELSCKAMCMHTCPTCDGEDELTLTAAILSDLVLYQLRDLAKELLDAKA